MSQTIGSQVESGFRTAGAWLLGFGWLVLLFGGMAISFSPEPSKYPRPVGWIFLVLVATTFIAAMNRWIKALPGILGLATFNSLFTIFSGHLTNHPDIPISRFEAITFTLMFGICSYLSLSFASRKLNLVDRIALLLFLSAIVWGVIYDSVISAPHRNPTHRSASLIALGVGACFFVGAWLYDRIHQRHHTASNEG